LRREHNERVQLAWNTAALSRAKKLPKLKTLLAPEPARQKKPRQTWQQQAAIMEAWAKAHNARMKQNGESR